MLRYPTVDSKSWAAQAGVCWHSTCWFLVVLQWLTHCYFAIWYFNVLLSGKWWNSGLFLTVTTDAVIKMTKFEDICDRRPSHQLEHTSSHYMRITISPIPICGINLAVSQQFLVNVVTIETSFNCFLNIFNNTVSHMNVEYGWLIELCKTVG